MNKLVSNFLPPLLTLLAVSVGPFFTMEVRADQTKANNNSNLELGVSWSSGTAPAGDNAVWNSIVTTPADCTNTLGGTAIWNGITINNPAAAVVINGNTTLTISNGINLGSATVGLTIP